MSQPNVQQPAAPNYQTNDEIPSEPASQSHLAQHPRLSDERLSDSGTAFENVPVNGNDDRKGVQVEKGGLDNSEPPFLTVRTFFMALLVSMGGICFGYDTGQISGFLEMEDFLYNFADTREPAYEFTWRRSGLIVGMLSIGTLCGALIAAPIANHRKIGRKYSISGWCIVFTIGNVFQLSAQYPYWYVMMIGRIISGTAIGGLSVLVPMFQSECAPSHIRGAIVCCYQLFITIGILLANLVNFGTESIDNSGSWRIPLGIGFIWGFILGIGILFFPETPRFNYRHGKLDLAQQSIANYHGVSMEHKVVKDQMAELAQKMREEEEGAEGRKWHEVFTGPRMRYRILLGVAIQMFQQLTGMNYFMYYGTTIFASVGLQNPFVIQLILGSVNVALTFPGLYMVEKFGRRKCLTIGALWMCGCFLVFASMGQFKLERADGSTDETAGSVMIVFACLFIAAFASTWGPMAWACVAEMYPGRYRSQAISYCSASNWFWNFYLGFFTPLITERINFAYGYVFAGCNLVAAIVVYLFLIESGGKSLEEIDTMYLLHVPPRKSSKWEVPVGEELVTAESIVREKNGLKGHHGGAGEGAVIGRDERIERA